MTVGLFSGPAQILALYFALVALAYMESDAFRHQAPLLGSIPYLTLTFCTLNLTMPERRRYLTALWLLLEAVSFYVVCTNRSILQWASLIMTFSNAVYLLSFADCVRRAWNELAILLIAYFGLLVYYCFADLYYSIPIYVILVSLNLATVCITVGAAGAVYKFGSRKRIYSNQVNFISNVNFIS
ncbi:unnamed protein product [Gongylonema pulchrum]|uniref:Transmembrane protein n=1 Tax=Gongylonema pulchrum TaxID=637853 RepID=A0A183DF93_9BILA|nr:unnamed protein product [Gongylonema pulchrum]